jgi:hypothetical protein
MNPPPYLATWSLAKGVRLFLDDGYIGLVDVDVPVLRLPAGVYHLRAELPGRAAQSVRVTILGHGSTQYHHFEFPLPPGTVTEDTARP